MRVIPLTLLPVSEAKNLKTKATSFHAVVSLEHDVSVTRSVTSNSAEPLWAESFSMYFPTPLPPPFLSLSFQACG